MILCYTCRQEPSITLIRGSIQQLMGAEQGPQPNIRWSLRNPVKTGRKDCRNQRDQGYHKKTHRITWPGLPGAPRDWTNKKPAWIWPGWDNLYCPNISSEYVMVVELNLRVTPNRGCLWLFYLVFELFSSYWVALFSLIWRKVPSLIATWYAMFCNTPGRPVLFWRKTEEELGGKEERETAVGM